jgi:membrane-bound ClpP family serine protease
MDSLIFYLGTFYILVGTIFLTVPIIYLELGKPKDLIKAFLNLLIGLILIIKNKTLDESFFVIFLFFTVLVIFYLVELFLFRWYQLTDNEKKKLTTFLEFKNNFSKILESINLGVGDFKKPSNFFNFGSDSKKQTPKKWVRNGKNDENARNDNIKV